MLNAYIIIVVNMKMPCEIIIWYVLPGIRREITKNMIKNGLTQKEAAKKLGITDAAVSQYLSEKRGGVEIKDRKILGEIKDSAKRIVAGDKSTMMEETCRICNLIKSRKNAVTLQLKKTEKEAEKCRKTQCAVCI